METYGIRRIGTPTGWFWASALLLPVSLLTVFVIRYGESVPIWEMWYFMPVWADYHNHGPWPHDLLITRWGHIEALPNFVNLMLDSMFNYDQRADIYASFIVTIATLYLLLKFYIPKRAIFSAIFLGTTFLTLRAAEIWLDGFNITMMIPLLLSVGAGAIVLHSQTWKGLIATMLLTFLGVNSGGYCLPLIPAIFVVLAVQTWLQSRPRTQHILRVVAWVVCSVLILRYWGWMRGGSSQAVMQTLSSGKFYTLFIDLIGFVLSPVPSIGIAIFAISVVVVLFAAPFGFNGSRGTIGLALPFIFLCVFSCVLALLIGTGRDLTGTPPLENRYIPFLCLFPISLLAFAETAVSNSAVDVARARLIVSVRVVLLAFIAIALYNSYAYVRATRGDRYSLGALNRAYLQAPDTLTPGMFLGRAADDPQLVEQGLAIMKELHAGPFRATLPSADGKLQAAPRTDVLMARDSFPLGIDQFRRDASGNLIIVGWAFDSKAGSPPQVVYAKAGDRCAETALTRLPRGDVATALHTQAARPTGWTITFPSRCIANFQGDVKLYFVSRGGRWTSLDRPVSNARP